MNEDSTKRFSGRVEDYVRYRPGYPAEIIDFLQQEFGLDKDKIIADIGSGTGISSKLFLHAGYRVFAVEPNREMREKSMALLDGFPGFRAVNGLAENTGLPAESIDAVIAGQAFHWFDAEKSKAEFKRILKEKGIVVLLWNERETGTPFEKEYDKLIIRHGKDYTQVDHRNINTEYIAAFYAPASFQLKIFENYQVFDFDGLKGRLLSSSYVPARNEAGFEDMIIDLKSLFDRFRENDLIRINYATKVYCGRFK